MHHFKNTNIGIYTVTLDGGASLGTIDGYAASAAYGLASITGISVSATGSHTLRLAMKAKNASSSNYLYAPVTIAMTRTGA
jgi:hypothetical protein